MRFADTTPLTLGTDLSLLTQPSPHSRVLFTLLRSTQAAARPVRFGTTVVGQVAALPGCPLLGVLTLDTVGGLPRMTP